MSFDRRGFLVVSPDALDRARALGHLPPRHGAYGGYTDATVATEAHRAIRQGRPGDLLLCIDPEAARGVVLSYGSGFIRIHGPLPLRAVEAVHELPLRRPGPFGLPEGYDAIYKGQLIRDRRSKMPGVPTAEEAAALIAEILKASWEDEGVPAVDVADTVSDVWMSLSYERLPASVIEELDAWAVARWPEPASDGYEHWLAFVELAAEGLPRGRAAGRHRGETDAEGG